MMIFKCGQIYKIDCGGTKTILGPAGTLRAPAGKTASSFTKPVTQHTMPLLFTIMSAYALLLVSECFSFIPLMLVAI